MKKLLLLIKKDPMLPVSLLAAVISLFITPPSKNLIFAIDWHTLGILFMMLTVLEGFKQENIFKPIISFSMRAEKEIIRHGEPNALITINRKCCIFCSQT